MVTGGAGFIGSHLVEALLARGLEVRCLVRDPANPKWLAGLDVELVRGDIDEPESLKRIFGGVDYVFHAAGITKTADPADYYRVNAEGTKNLALAAIEGDNGGRLQKFVLVSSQAAAGPSREGTPRREDDPPAPVTDYGKSKLMGEKYAIELKDKLPLVIVRPPSIYGPRDKDVYTFFKLVSHGIRTTFREKRLISMCYVGDLVDGILSAAFRKTVSGEVFFIADPTPYGWDDMGEAIAVALGTRATRVVVPVPVLSVVAAVSEAVAALTGRPALLNRQKMAEIRQRYWVLDVEKAKEMLGFVAAHDFKTGARLTVEWYRRQGWI